MKAIIAVNNLGYIGLNNGIPWRSKEDFKHFKKMTMDGTLLAGFNTFSTLPSLPGRSVMQDNRTLCEFPELIDWCIGGKKTYEKYCHLFTELHISYINDNTIGDCMFPDLKNLNPDCKIFKYYFETNENKSN